MFNRRSSEPERLTSLDAYRGFIMLVMVSAGFGFTAVARHFDAPHPAQILGYQFDESQVWRFLGKQFDHVTWGDCAFWDLIQPSFMFMVGVAMPFSHASRLGKGQSRWKI